VCIAGRGWQAEPLAGGFCGPGSETHTEVHSSSREAWMVCRSRKRGSRDFGRFLLVLGGVFVEYGRGTWTCGLYCGWWVLTQPLG
jgi:hypothetical protein